MKNSKKPPEVELEKDWSDLKGLPPQAYYLLKEESQLAFAVIRLRITGKSRGSSAEYMTWFDDFVYMSDAWTNEMSNYKLNAWNEDESLPAKHRYKDSALIYGRSLLWTSKQVQKAIEDTIKEMRTRAHDRIEALKEVIQTQNRLIETYCGRQRSLFNEPYYELVQAMPQKKGDPEGAMPRTFYRQGPFGTGRRRPMPKFRPE